MNSDLSFSAIDFETANSSRASVCAVGAVRVRAGQIVDRFYTLVQPPTGIDSFHPRNIQVHGITPEQVADAPEWDEAFTALMRFVQGDDLIAHNASFDRSVLYESCSALDLDWPKNQWWDSLELSRRFLTLGSYSLPFVCNSLNFGEFEHHNAAADAEQAARVVVTLAQRAGLADLNDLFRHVPAGRVAEGARSAGDFVGLGEVRSLSGEKVAFTGALQLIKRDEAIRLVEQLGGTGQSSVNKSTTLLVTGGFDTRSFRPGAAMSSKLQRALELARSGQAIEILTEDEFITRTELAREDIEQATREQRVASGRSLVPDYVMSNAREINGQAIAYNLWIRKILSNPAGRAEAGALCIRCQDQIPANTYWLYLERHVCGSRCGESLKRAARRLIAQAGLTTPPPPEYQEWR